MNTVVFSSKTVEWATPEALFQELHEEFHFTLDPCATRQNAKCRTFFTKDDDGLAQDWRGHHVFMNPPYGRTIGRWIRKASEVVAGVAVCLLPARTDTTWFHDYVLGHGTIRFLRGRLRFSGSASPAPFPSMIVIFDNRKAGHHLPPIVAWDRSQQAIAALVSVALADNTPLLARG